MDKFSTLLKYGESKSIYNLVEQLGLNELMYIKCLEQRLAGKGTQEMSVIAARDLVCCGNVLGFINFRHVACRIDDRVGAVVSGVPTVLLQASAA